MYLDKQHPRPVYIQLKEMLQGQIENGLYLSHQKLPSERDLCQQHQLSRMTARKALKALIAEGFAYTQAGKGTFVSARSGQPDNGKERISINNFNSANRSNNGEIKQQLVNHLLSFNCVGAEQVVSEALSTHSIETVAGELFSDVIRFLERQWQNGEVSLSAHNYAITTLRTQLTAMVNAAAMASSGPKALLCCAPGDWHELGLLFLALSLRRRGFLVVYLGSNSTVDETHQVIEATQPDIVCVSAATQQAAGKLKRLGEHCLNRNVVSTKTHPQKPVFTFGGVAFAQNPELIRNVPGVYLGDSIDQAVLKIQNLVYVNNEVFLC